MKLIELELARWGQWSRERQRLGYPAAASCTYAPPIAAANSGEAPAIVRLIEDALISLPAAERRAIALKYCEIRLNDAERARRLKVSRAQYRIMLDRGRWYVAGRIGR